MDYRPSPMYPGDVMSHEEQTFFKPKGPKNTGRNSPQGQIRAANGSQSSNYTMPVRWPAPERGSR